MAKINLTTENVIVNAVGRMAITGNVVPESWYKTVVSSKGRVLNNMTETERLQFIRQGGWSLIEELSMSVLYGKT